MRGDARACLHDIVQAADDIAEFTAVSFDAYVADKRARLSVERQFTVIGEALKALSRLEPALLARLPTVSSMIAFRNILIHRYQAIDQSIVYQHARSSLPKLREAAAALLAELDRG
jgi:uncharacterized protein with HEPN domain